jgi:DNA polymerase-1
MEAIKQNAHQDGYVSTIYGRKIFLPSINSSNNILRQAEERLALNAPMQGRAADIIKIAMLNVAGWIEANKLKSKLIMQVHDELIFQVPENELDLLMNNLARLMTESIKLNVPLEVDINAAENWADAH